LVAGGVPAYDATTLQELWSNPSIPTRQSFTARFTDSADERLLVLSSTGRTFSVWDASDGSYLDETASFSGSPQYFLKHFDGESELVTYDAATHTARVYRLTGVPRRVETLSCYFIPGTGCVRLRWGAVEGASAYRIYVGDSVDGAMQLFAEVPSGTEYHYLPTTSDVKFFSVTAVYEEP